MRLKELHHALQADVRDVRWHANCAGEVFLERADEEAPVRIGHFQGDAALAAFVVEAHNRQLAVNANS